MGKKQQFPDPEIVAECNAEEAFARRILERTKCGELQWVKVEDQDAFRSLHDGMWADWYTTLAGNTTVGIHLCFQPCYCGSRHCALVVFRPGTRHISIGGTGVLDHTAIVRELADLPVFALPPPSPSLPYLKVSEVLEGV